MRFLILAFISTLWHAHPAAAQDVSASPVCTQIVNKADYTVRGTVSTDKAPLADGTLARHTANFRLAPGETMDLCSRGPFYPGRRLDFQIRTLIPIFECRTTLSAPIVIESAVGADGERRTWASCS